MQLNTSVADMRYWYPLVNDLDIPMPETIEIPFKNHIIDMIESDSVERQELVNDVWDTIQRSDFDLREPLFMRTGLTSGKHEWIDTCYLPGYLRKEKLARNIYYLIEDNLIKDQFPVSIFIREFLSLRWSFTAFNGFPVSTEVRLFVKDGDVICWHNYWPKDAIQRPSAKDWECHLDRQDDTIKSQINHVMIQARKISNRLDNYWSVDFALGTNGKWYFIDAAPGIWSYHVLDCDKKLTIADLGGIE